TIARTPGNADNLGQGFGMPTFLSTRGHFFSIAANTGDLRVWIARNDVTWGPSNGLTVGTGFTQTPLMLFNHQTILGVDEEGYLWSTPVSVTGVPGSKSRVGSGWNRFKQIVSFGTTLLGMEENGDF